MPKRGDYVQRIETGEIGTVEVVAVAGQPNHTNNPFLMAGDISVWLRPGRSIVTSGNIFWQRWRPVDIAALAEQVLRLALEAA
jgi:hypothetical protein